MQDAAVLSTPYTAIAWLLQVCDSRIIDMK